MAKEKAKKLQEKHYKLSQEEKDEMTNLNRISEDLYFQQQGIRRLMDLVLIKTEVRVGIAMNKAPEGMKRMVDYDSNSFEIVERFIDGIVEAPKTKKN